MPANHFSIFAFDQTISKKPTFDESCMEELKHNDSDMTLEHIAGYAFASRNGLKAYFPEPLNSKGLNDHPFAIATYHNNPDFIAGYLAELLDKKINPVTTPPIHDSKAPEVAVKEYTIEGLSHPLLISYIAIEHNLEFHERLKKLEGKNNQIRLLHEIALEKALVSEETQYFFYDDSQPNINQIRQLNNLLITACKVDPEQEDQFTVTSRTTYPRVSEYYRYAVEQEVPDRPYHFFKAKMAGRRETGDRLKTILLEEITQDMRQAVKRCCFEDAYNEILESKKFKVLATSQGIFSWLFRRKTDSVKAFEAIANDLRPR